MMTVKDSKDELVSDIRLGIQWAISFSVLLPLHISMSVYWLMTFNKQMRR